MENSLSTNKLNQDILKTLRQVSLVFFFLIGSTHIFSGLLSSQNIFMPLSNNLNRILDIPFVIIALLYGLSQKRVSAESPYRKVYFSFMLLILLSALGILLYINLFLPDLTF